MSKLCKTEKEADETVKWYQERYKSGLSPYDSPSKKLSEKGDYWIVIINQQIKY